MDDTFVEFSARKEQKESFVYYISLLLLLLMIPIMLSAFFTIILPWLIQMLISFIHFCEAGNHVSRIFQKSLKFLLLLLLSSSSSLSLLSAH
jgi:hypothetical protein